MRVIKVCLATAIAVSAFLTPTGLKEANADSEPPSQEQLNQKETNDITQFLEITLDRVIFRSDLADNGPVFRPGPSRLEKEREEERRRQQELAEKMASERAERERIARAAQIALENSNSQERVGNKSNGYYYGYCTYYVAGRRDVPTTWGNARNWLAGAIRDGYATGSDPRPGAILVTSESRNGHVAYVEEVTESEIVIAEMNATAGWNRVDRRTLPRESSRIRGYIY